MSWELIKKVDDAIDSTFEASGLPALTGGFTGLVGQGVDTLAGTNVAPTMEQIGRGLPRMITEAALTIPAAATSGPVGPMAIWANRLHKLGQITGYGSTALKGTAETESPLGGLISAGSLGLGNKLLLPARLGGVDVGGRASDYMRKLLGYEARTIPSTAEAANLLTPDLRKLGEGALDTITPLQSVAGATARYGTDVATITGLMEGTRQAQMSVGPNALPLNAPERNLITPENIAGAATGALMFAPQFIHSVIRRPKFAPEQVAKMGEWIKSRREAEKASHLPYRGYDWEGPITPEAYQDTFGTLEGAPVLRGKDQTPVEDYYEFIQSDEVSPKRVAREKFHSQLRLQLSLLGQQESEGQVELASKTRQSIVNVLSGLDQSDPEQIRVTAKMLDVQARQLPPEDVIGVKEFIQDLNILIGQINDNTWENFTDEQKREITKGKTWHPNAAHPSVVENLRARGFLPQITEEYLAKQYKEKFEELGDPRLAYQAVLQSEVNSTLDVLPNLIEQEKATRPPVDVKPTELDPQKQGQYTAFNQEMSQFVDALNALPESAKEGVTDRTVSIFSQQPNISDRRNQTFGRPIGSAGNWRKAVIYAMETYNPEQGTVMLWDNTKKEFAPKPLEYLYKTDENGNFLWNPGQSLVPIPEGGTRRNRKWVGDKKVMVEGKVKLVPVYTNVPEDSLNRPINETGITLGDVVADKITEPLSEDKKKEIDRLTSFKKEVDHAKEVLNDKQLYQAAQDVFMRRAENAGIGSGIDLLRMYRSQGGLRLAIDAALENFKTFGDDSIQIGPAGKAFLDAERARGLGLAPGTDKKKLRVQLLTFFKATDDKTFLENFGRVLKKIIDPKVQKMVKSGVESRTMPGESGEAPLILFSAPVRLERWLEKPSMGFFPDREGAIKGQQVRPLLQKLGISNDELSIYNDAGLGEIVAQPNVTVAKLITWLNEKTPKVEVKKLQPLTQEDKQRALDYSDIDILRMHRMAHELDSLLPNWRNVDSRELSDDLRKKVEDYYYVESQSDISFDTDAATGRYGVEPKELKDMPGAVDILVRVPTKKVGGYIEPKLYRGPHFGDSDVNVLASIRGYMETLPSGEKVFHVFEVQSDWGQKVAKEAQRTDSEKRGAAYFESLGTSMTQQSHPLLTHYETLALKTAIQHARAEGAKYIAISDAETAMMTEGHDRQKNIIVELVNNSRNRDFIDKFQDEKGYWKKHLNSRGNLDLPLQNYPLEKLIAELGDENVITKVGEPSQAKGMRAAYDERLPAIAQRLTGDGGRKVEFGRHKAVIGAMNEGRSDYITGSPVFKDPNGTSKKTITARLYDISHTPDEFAAFGYSRPSAGESVTSTSATPVGDLFVNTQPPGSFTPDVVNALRSKFSQILGRTGVSGTLRDLYTEMAVALAKQTDRVPVDFYSIVGKEWGLANVEDGRGKLGLRLDESVAPGQETKYINRILATLAHEISHIDSIILEGLIDAPDAFSEQRRRILMNFRDFSQVLSTDEREAILMTIRDGFWPKSAQWDVRTKDGRMYGSNNPEEFVATVNELLSASILRGKREGMKSVLEVLDFSPTEIREFSRGTYRAIYDVLDSLKQTISDPSIRVMLGKPELSGINPFFTSEAFHAVINAAREGSELRNADYSLAQARAAFASMSPGAASAPPLVSPAMWFRTGKDIQENYPADSTLHAMPSETAIDAMKTAIDFFGPKDKSKVNWFVDWFYPFQQRMFAMERAGVPLARPIANLALDLKPGISRTYTQIMSPFLIQGPDGHFHMDQNNLGLQKLNNEKNGPWRKAVNEVSAWQNEHNTQPMFLKGKDGIVLINPDIKLKAQESWEKISKGLSFEDQQVVQSMSVSLDQVHQIAAQRLVATIDVSNRYYTARLIMAMNPKMVYNTALDLSDKIVGSFLKGDVSSVERTGLPKPQLQQLEGLLLGPEGLLGKFNEVQDKLLSRPGFRTESLPGDYILRFKTPEGKIRFLSADSKGRAYHLARRLEREGNVMTGPIATKEELRNYTDFDAPDEILNKFIQIEGDVWQKFLHGIESTQGGLLSQETIDALRGFTPGGAAEKEIATQGMNRFLKERKSRVDRSRYDYVDGTIAWAGRLSSSMEYKTTRQIKNIILADPRMKAFPSFQGQIEPFFDNLMQPTGEFARDMKTFATAYMIGDSLGSAIINATQSVVTLVPTLIQLGTGGPVDAYKALWRATAKATLVSVDPSWQKEAAVAEKIIPEKWTLSQAQAALYKRNLLEGGIQQGIIQDNIFTPSDQRTAMIQKFGHGDYGPVTAGELARSGLYLVSQLSLRPFGWVEAFNNKISLFSGVEQGWKKGLRGEELYDHAKLVKTLSTFGGGKSNVPGLVPKLSTPYTHSVVAIANTLQQYAYGAVASYGQLLKDSLGKSEALSPLERKQAQKALGTMLATQVAIAGALGLPFAGAALTVLENIFGIPANQLVRQGLTTLGSFDEDSGAAIAETALNGLGNQMFGIDVSSRAGVSSFAGTSSYRGFNLADMTGPMGSIIQNATQALGWFGQGEPVKATRALVPNSLKTLMDLSDSQAKYGDFGIRDSSDNLLYQPTPSQAIMYVAGFRPREVSEKRQAQKMLTFANQRATRQRGLELDSARNSLLNGDPSQALMLAQNAYYADPTVDPKAILRSVVSRAVDSTTERDLLAFGPSSNEEERQSIAGTFGSGVVSRQSEIQRTILASKLGALVGLQPDPKTFQKAVLVDALVRTRGIPRSQALRLVEFLQ